MLSRMETCEVRSRCEVKVRAEQRPQKLGSLKEERAKGSLCHLLPIHPRLRFRKWEAFFGLTEAFTKSRFLLC